MGEHFCRMVEDGLDAMQYRDSADRPCAEQIQLCKRGIRKLACVLWVPHEDVPQACRLRFHLRCSPRDGNESCAECSGGLE